MAETCATAPIDVAGMAASLRTAGLVEPGQVFEVRLANVSTPTNRRRHTESGFFTAENLEAACAAVVDLERSASGVYLALNPIAPELLARRANRVDVAKGGQLATDRDIVRRRLLLIDADPVRPDGISATDEEKAAALATVTAVREFLHERGFLPMVLCDSGNGYHLLIHIDLPNDDESRDLVRQVLLALAAKFDTPAVKIDTKVFNASRITKFYGTMAKKGDSTPERPHRRSAILDVPDGVKVTPRELLEALAAEAPPDKGKPAAANGQKDHRHAGDSRSDVLVRAMKYVAKMPAAISGSGGHDATWNVAQLLVRGFALTEVEAWPILTEFSDRCQPPWSEKELRHKLEDAQKNSRLASGYLLNGDEHVGGGPPAAEVDGGEEFRSDMGNGARMARQYGDEIRFCKPWDKWLVWQDGRWKIDDTLKIMRLAKGVAKRLWKEACELSRAAESRLAANADDAQGKALMGRAQNLFKHAARTQARERLSAMVSLCGSEPSVVVVPDQLDTDPFLLNCANGTVDLRTGELRPHRREDLLTKMCRTPYNPAAECPTFLQFLASIFPNPNDASEEAGDRELIGFVQRWSGYCATGDVREQVLVIAYGEGANGKGTFFNTVTYTLGKDYAGCAPPQLLISSPKFPRHPTELADLFGRRLIIAHESRDGDSFNEELVKQLIGGDPIKGRRCFENFWEFDPTHKVVLQTNHKPHVSGEDNAIWRRLRLLPFVVQFWSPNDPIRTAGERPERLRQDKALAGKLMAEAAGILAWIVRGAVEWYRDGLGAAAAVTDATRMYRDSESIVGQFIADECITGPDRKQTAAKLYKHFRQYRTDAGEGFIPSQKRFAKSMERLGYETMKSSCNWYVGIDVRDPLADPPDRAAF
jgi:putative DNA primase/helicase